jgi:hypothetical protein
LASKLAVSIKSPASIAAKISRSDVGIHIIKSLLRALYVLDHHAGRFDACWRWRQGGVKNDSVHTPWHPQFRVFGLSMGNKESRRADSNR